MIPPELAREVEATLRQSAFAGARGLLDSFVEASGHPFDGAPEPEQLAGLAADLELLPYDDVQALCRHPGARLWPELFEALGRDLLRRADAGRSDAAGRGA